MPYGTIYGIIGIISSLYDVFTHYDKKEVCQKGYLPHHKGSVAYILAKSKK